MSEGAILEYSDNFLMLKNIVKYNNRNDVKHC